MSTHRFLFRCDEGIFKALKATAKKNGVSINTLLWQILKEHFKK